MTGARDLEGVGEFAGLIGDDGGSEDNFMTWSIDQPRMSLEEGTSVEVDEMEEFREVFAEDRGVGVRC